MSAAWFVKWDDNEQEIFRTFEEALARFMQVWPESESAELTWSS